MESGDRVEPSDHIRGVTTAEAVENAHAHDLRQFGNSICEPTDGSGYMRAVPVAVVWVGVVVDFVDALDGFVFACSGTELLVRIANTSVDHVHHNVLPIVVARCAAGGCDVGVVQRQCRLVDSVQSPCGRSLGG